MSKLNIVQKFKIANAKKREQFQREYLKLCEQIKELEKQKKELEGLINLFDKLGDAPLPETALDTKQHNQVILGALGQESKPLLPVQRITYNDTKTVVMSPCSPAGIELGKKLQGEMFDAKKLRESFPAGFHNEYQTAYTWIATWKGKGWIDTISSGWYTVNETFGI